MELASIVLVCCAEVLYLAASVLYAYQLKTKTERYPLLPICIAGAALVFQTALIGVVAKSLSGTPLTGASILMLASWTIMVAYFVFELISKRRSYGFFIVPVVLVSMVVAWNLGAGNAPAQGNAVYTEWPLLVIHVVAYFVAAALFLLGGASAIMLLYQEKQLKKKNYDVTMGRMPGLSFLKKVMRRSVLIGLPIFFLGILLGTVRAIGLDTPNWWMSSRIICSVAVLAIYCVILVEAYIVHASSNTIAKTHIVASLLVIVLTVFSAVMPMLGS